MRRFQLRGVYLNGRANPVILLSRPKEEVCFPETSYTLRQIVPCSRAPESRGQLIHVLLQLHRLARLPGKHTRIFGDQAYLGGNKLL